MKQKKLVLTTEEEKLILEERKKKERNKPRKIGFLKEDLYEYNPPTGKYGLWSFFNESEKNIEIEQFKLLFKRTMCAGEEFVCFINDDKNEEFWYDRDGRGYECLSSNWAKENLINIQDIK